MLDKIFVDLIPRACPDWMRKLKGRPLALQKGTLVGICPLCPSTSTVDFHRLSGA